MRFRFVKVFLGFAVLQCALLVSTASAANVSLAWNSNSESNLAGYRLYIGSSSGSYQSIVSVGDTTSVTVNNLLPEKRYYFSLTALNSSGYESEHSNEISTIAKLTDSEVDSDGDGLTDEQELEYGTDKDNRDTDNDGVADGQEIIDGTDPLDQGSLKLVLGKRICAEWNGFLNNLWNILEVANGGSKTVSVDVSFYDSGGVLVAQSEVSVASKSQVDLLVHDSQARRENAYGLVCLNHSGAAGDIDGRMVYYKGLPSPTTAGFGFQFAFAMPFSSGKYGRQVIPFNTYNPSFRSEDGINPVANWIQVTNLSKRNVSGTMVYYDLSGAELGRQSRMIRPMERVDLSAHQFGQSKAGMVVWNPDDVFARVQVRNVRYVYDNPYLDDSFDSAFQLEGIQGSSKSLFVPYDTNQEISVLEVFSASDRRSVVTINFYSNTGILQTLAIDLPPFASRHIVINELLGEGQLGVVKVKSISGGVVGSVVMQYAKESDGGLAYMFGLTARPAYVTTSRGSYNTFLQQESELIVVNSLAVNKTASINLEATSGVNSSQVFQQELAGHGVSITRLNDYQAADRYGTVEIHGDTESAFLSWVLRRRGQEYVIPTSIR